jgi:hypothetical protein
LEVATPLVFRVFRQRFSAMNPVLASLFSTGVPDLEAKGQSLPPDGQPSADAGGEQFLTELGKAFARLSGEGALMARSAPEVTEEGAIEGEVVGEGEPGNRAMPAAPTLQALRLSETLTILVPAQPVPEVQVADYARRIGLSEEALRAILPEATAPSPPIPPSLPVAAIVSAASAPSSAQQVLVSLAAATPTESAGEVVKLTITPPTPEPVRLVWPQAVAERWLEARGETFTSRAMSIKTDHTEIAKMAEVGRQQAFRLDPIKLDAVMTPARAEATVQVLTLAEGAMPAAHPKTPESAASASVTSGGGLAAASAAALDPTAAGGESSGQPGQSGQESGRQFSQQMAQRFSELVSQRLIQQVQQGQWKVEIEIHPRDLGSIQIEMQWNDGQLEAMFETTHAATRELLLDNLPRLRESLQKFGTDVAYLGVGADSRQKNGGDGSSHPGRRGRSDRWEDSSAAAVSAESGLKLARSGHSGELDVLV